MTTLAPPRGIFDTLYTAPSLVRNRETLRPTWVPQDLPGRDEAVQTLATVLVPALRGEATSNISIRGPAGSGKTALIRRVGQELKDKAAAEGATVHVVYIDCKQIDTQYRVLTHIANHFIDEWQARVPFTGWPTNEVYDKLLQKIDENPVNIVVILDSIEDLVFKSGDSVLYNLGRLRASLENARLSYVFTSRTADFASFVDPVTRSFVEENVLNLAPYTYGELVQILNDRVTAAFNQTTGNGIIDQCAMRAAQKTDTRPGGDARFAVDLLRATVEVAEKECAREITEHHVRRAQSKLDTDRVSDVVRTLPLQAKLVLLAQVHLEEEGDETTDTGKVHDHYSKLARAVGLDALTQRRVTDLISEQDMLGTLHARVTSRGRYGRSKEITLAVDRDAARRILSEDPALVDVMNATTGQLRIL